MTGSGPVAASGRPRIIGVDVARGLALLGMMATHVFATVNADGTPTAATVIAAGRSAGTFVLVAGVSLAFMSGGRTVVRGRERTAVAAGLAVRALLIGAIGLVLGAFQVDQLDVILAFYGLLFLLAIPLLGLSSLVLAGISAALIAVGPVLLVATARAGLSYASFADPTIGALVRDPLGLLVQLFFTGSYPVVVYLGYLVAGLAIGRLDLSTRTPAWWLFGGGLALAVTARAVAQVLLYPLGGLARLVAGSGIPGDPARAARLLLWEPKQGASWWYLALPSPHAHSTIDAVYTLGSAMAVLGASLLLTRVPVVRRLLWPVAVVGTMTLTLYTAHVLLIATGLLRDHRWALYILMVAGGVAFALLWRRRFRQGPLERFVAVTAGRARRAVAERSAVRSASDGP